MKRLFLLLVIVILFSLGCTSMIEKEDKTVCYKPYYEFKTGTCCLDNNNNKICDIDELKETKDKIIVEDSCDLGYLFECSDIEIKKDEVLGDHIRFKLRFGGDGVGIIKKISFPELNCEEEINEDFDTASRWGETKEYFIACPLEEGEITSSIEIDYVFYKEITLGKESTRTGTFEPVTDMLTAKGTITGTA